MDCLCLSFDIRKNGSTTVRCLHELDGSCLAVTQIFSEVSQQVGIKFWPTGLHFVLPISSQFTLNPTKDADVSHILKKIEEHFLFVGAVYDVKFWSEELTQKKKRNESKHRLLATGIPKASVTALPRSSEKIQEAVREKGGVTEWYENQVIFLFFLQNKEKLSVTTNHCFISFWYPQLKCPNVNLYLTDILWIGRAKHPSGQTADVFRGQFTRLVDVAI